MTFLHQSQINPSSDTIYIFTGVEMEEKREAFTQIVDRVTNHLFQNPELLANEDELTDYVDEVTREVAGQGDDNQSPTVYLLLRRGKIMREITTIKGVDYTFIGSGFQFEPDAFSRAVELACEKIEEYENSPNPETLVSLADRASYEATAHWVGINSSPLMAPYLEVITRD